MAIKRENTLVVTARIDARDLATVVKWWTKTLGGRPNSMSFLVKEVIGQMADIMVREHPDVLVDSQQEAFEVIEASMLNARTSKSQRAISRGLQREQATIGAGFSQYDEVGERKPAKDPFIELNEICLGMLKQGVSFEEVELTRKNRTEQLLAEKAAKQAEQQTTVEQGIKWANEQRAGLADKPQLSDEQRLALGIRLHAELWVSELVKPKSSRQSLNWLKFQMIKNFGKPPISLELEDPNKQNEMLELVVDEANRQFAQIDLAAIEAEREAKLAAQQAKHISGDDQTPEQLAEYARKRDEAQLAKLKSMPAVPS